MQVWFANNSREIAFFFKKLRQIILRAIQMRQKGCIRSQASYKTSPRVRRVRLGDGSGSTFARSIDGSSSSLNAKNVLNPLSWTISCRYRVCVRRASQSIEEINKLPDSDRLFFGNCGLCQTWPNRGYFLVDESDISLDLHWRTSRACSLVSPCYTR